ncbi:MAG: YibE/F family protein [Treponema sp.]
MNRPKFNNTSVTVIVSVVFAAFLFLLPTGFEGALQFRDAVKCRALVEAVDNSRIIDTGLIRTGQQVCSVRFLNGKFKGMTAEGWNMLTGSLSQDKLFVPGDKAQVIVHWQETEPGEEGEAGETTETAGREGEIEFLSVNLIDYYRLKGELVLALAFAVFLIAFAGATGVRSVLSFVITVLTLWKILVPMYLKGYDPLLCGCAVTVLLTVIILSLVYGFDRRLLSSVSGALLGIGLAAVLSVICTRTFKIHGAVMAYSESVLYSGYEYLNLTRIFMSSILVGASGSIMDLSVDITSAVNEVVKKCPSISRLEAVKSGLAVARAAMGTMTTTLLLAYSGSCISLLMTFMAQGTPLYNILNNNQVAAEIINTIAGSFGLASTAPFTALMSGVILAGRKK